MERESGIKIYKLRRTEMKQLKKRSGYEETSVAFDILGQPKRCSNPDYIPSDTEYNALREVCPWLTNMGKQVRVDRAVKKFI